MQLTHLASAVALVASVSAFASDPHVFNYNATCDESQPKVRIVNRCPYKVYLWSVLKGQGCPVNEAVVLDTGAFYHENFRDPHENAGVSIKISKTEKCKGVDTTQLEYFIDSSPQYGANYLDVSFVDCSGNDCPGRDGYYLKSGNEGGRFKANDVNEICPILSCNSVEECAKYSYILPDDRQTKSCNADANLDFYICGGEAPEEYVPEASSSHDEPASTPNSPAYSVADANAAAITRAPEPKTREPKIKTEVVYVTEIEYVHAKRHVHDHAHRHHQFRA